MLSMNQFQLPEKPPFIHAVREVLGLHGATGLCEPTVDEDRHSSVALTRWNPFIQPLPFHIRQNHILEIFFRPATRWALFLAFSTGLLFALTELCAYAAVREVAPSRWEELKRINDYAASGEDAVADGPFPEYPDNLPVTQTLLWRSIILAGLGNVILLATRQQLLPFVVYQRDWRKVRYLVLHSIADFIMAFATVVLMKHTNASVSLISTYTVPSAATLTAALFLQNPYSFKDFFFLMASGGFLILATWENVIQAAPVWQPWVISALIVLPVTFGAAYCFHRVLKNDGHPLQMAVFGSYVSIAFCLFVQLLAIPGEVHWPITSLPAPIWGYWTGFSVLGLLAPACIHLSMNFLSAPITNLIVSMEVPFVMIFQATIMNEPMTDSAIAGCIMLMLTSVAVIQWGTKPVSVKETDRGEGRGLHNIQQGPTRAIFSKSGFEDHKEQSGTFSEMNSTDGLSRSNSSVPSKVYGASSDSSADKASDLRMPRLNTLASDSTFQDDLPYGHGVQNTCGVAIPLDDEEFGFRSQEDEDESSPLTCASRSPSRSPGTPPV